MAAEIPANYCVCEIDVIITPNVFNASGQYLLQIAKNITVNVATGTQLLSAPVLVINADTIAAIQANVDAAIISPATCVISIDDWIPQIGVDNGSLKLKIGLEPSTVQQRGGAALTPTGE